jgi:threonine dehydrogenase-like Zn-dependent dehydrogenase
MRAVRVTNGTIGVVDVPAPQGDGVKVRIRSAGICGSDLHMLERSVMRSPAS